MCRTYFEHQIYELLRRIPLYVELRFENRFEAEYIVTAYMSLVGARMDCDAVGAKPLYVERDRFKVWIVFATGVS